MVSCHELSTCVFQSGADSRRRLRLVGRKDGAGEAEKVEADEPFSAKARLSRLSAITIDQADRLGGGCLEWAARGWMQVAESESESESERDLDATRCART